MSEPEMTPFEKMNFNIFIDFLATMLEKYAGTIDWDELKERSEEDERLR